MTPNSKIYCSAASRVQGEPVGLGHEITIEIRGIKQQDWLYQNQCKYNHFCCAKFQCVNEINLTDERREEILVKRLQNYSSKEKLLLGWRQEKNNLS